VSSEQDQGYNFGVEREAFQSRPARRCFLVSSLPFKSGILGLTYIRPFRNRLNEAEDLKSFVLGFDASAMVVGRTPIL
jgi:hypothetical protein